MAYFPFMIACGAQRVVGGIVDICAQTHTAVFARIGNIVIVELHEIVVCRLRKQVIYCRHLGSEPPSSGGEEPQLAVAYPYGREIPYDVGARVYVYLSVQ